MPLTLRWTTERTSSTYVLISLYQPANRKSKKHRAFPSTNVVLNESCSKMQQEKDSATPQLVILAVGMRTDGFFSQHALNDYHWRRMPRGNFSPRDFGRCPTPGTGATLLNL
jgi:hypothetical protein